MLRPLLLIALCYIAVFSTPLLGQTIITGKVLEKDKNEPLVGASIVIKGTSRGSITDVDGNYRLEIQEEEFESGTLLFSYIGFKSREIRINNRTVIDVELEADATQLNEVVVTAFGVESERKALNYSIQELESQQITESNQDNVINALQGKIAGVQITNTSGSPGASSQILIRGANSIDASTNNEPLIVVDGIPISNSAAFGGANRLFDINPNDIESVTVLKSGAAAALYGAVASNGVIIITTKSGKEGVSTVNATASVSVDRAFRTAPRQMLYKQGTGGVFDEGTTSNWGPLVTTNEVVYDNVDNFLDIGIRQKYDVSASSGSEKANGYISGNYLNHKGIFPGERLTRYGLLLKGTQQLRDNLSLSASFNLINTENARAGYGIMYSIYRWPINNDMSEYLNPDGTKNWLIERDPGQEWNNPENPYWRAENNLRKDNVNRIVPTMTLSWNISDPFTFTYRLGGDIINQHYKSITRPESAGSATTFGGMISESERSFNTITSTALLEFKKRVTEKFAINALAGHNLQADNGRLTMISGNGYMNPLLDNINNLQTIQPPYQSLSYRRTFGVFADIKFDYNGLLYLNVTGRNDWSSTLSKEKNSYFYPSISGGFVFSELLSSRDFLSFGKLRASWSSIGKDASPHRTSAVLKTYNAINRGFKYDYYSGNESLAPELSTTFEIGADLRFFNGKLTLDASYYNMTTNDAILTSRISPASGWIMLTFNSGSMQNKGIEIMADYEIMKSSDFSWNTLLNLSGNRSKVIELPSFVSRLPVTSAQYISAATPTSLLGEPLLAIEGTTYLYNENGQLVVDEDGYPRIGTYAKDADGNFILNSDGTRAIDGNPIYLGNREPKAIIGVTNTFKYKNFNLSFLVDIRVGGDVLNAANATLIANGSAGILEKHRNRSTVFEGVVEQEGGEFTDNTNAVVLDQSFWFNYAGVGSNFVEDASWTRLRYLTLGYTLPNSFADKIGMKALTVGITGRNLALWTKYSGGDPETSSGGSEIAGVGTAGVDYFNVPSVQGFDISLTANF